MNTYTWTHTQACSTNSICLAALPKNLPAFPKVVFLSSEGGLGDTRSLKSSRHAQRAPCVWLGCVAKVSCNIPQIGQGNVHFRLDLAMEAHLDLQNMFNLFLHSNRQTDKQTGRQTDRLPFCFLTESQVDQQTGKDGPTECQTNKQTNTCRQQKTTHTILEHKQNVTNTHNQWTNPTHTHQTTHESLID